MYQIVYLSRARTDWTDARLEQLAAYSAERNRVLEVTGMLLYDRTRFLQAIEGPEEAVRATMRRIAVDGRHDSIDYFSHAPVTERQFGSWSMLFKQVPDDCCSSAFLAGVKEGVTAVTDPTLQAAFIGFAALSIRRSERYDCKARVRTR